MNWQPPADKWHQKSEDGFYSVAKVSVCGQIVYEAYRCRAHRDGPKLLAVRLETAEAACKVCEQDGDDDEG